MSQSAQDSFFENESHDFLQLPQLPSTVNYIDSVANFKRLLFRQVALLHGSILENILHRSGEIKDPRKLIFIWYVGASYGLTPFRINFIDYVKCDIMVKYVTRINRVMGIGTALHKYINSDGKEVVLPCVSYHLTKNVVWLFSPQTYHHIHGGYSEVYYSRVSIYLAGR